MKISLTFSLLACVLAFGCAESTEQSTEDGGVRLDMSPVGTDAGSDASVVNDTGAPGLDEGFEPSDMGGGTVDFGTTPTDAAVATDTGIAPRDASVLPPADAGDPFVDAGPLGEPAWVPVDVRTSGNCEGFDACGGDVVGTWDVTNSCVSIPLGALLTACSGAEITYAGGMARGRVSFDGSVTTRLAQSDVEVDVFVPSSCATFVGGCSGVASAFGMATADSACVDDGDGNCNCSARQISNYDNTDTYTLTDTEIVTGAGKHYSYCVGADSSLTYEDTTPGMATSREPGIITLGMR